MTIKDPELLFSMYRESGERCLIPSRFHTVEFEICEILSGKTKARIGTNLIDAEAGDILFVPKGMAFRLESVEGKASVRGVVFDSYLVESDMANFDTEVLYMFSVQAENKNTVFKKEHPVACGITRSLNALYEEYLGKDVCYRLPIRAWLLLMMTDLLRYFCGMKNEQDRIAYHNVLRLRSVITYIGEHLSDKIYMEELSDMISVSPDYFTKMFKESIGKTPVDYINALRVNRALGLLLDDTVPVSDIAEKVGFSSSSYFHKIFSQYMEVSPTAYRKAIKSENDRPVFKNDI